MGGKVIVTGCQGGRSVSMGGERADVVRSNSRNVSTWRGRGCRGALDGLFRVSWRFLCLEDGGADR